MTISQKQQQLKTFTLSVLTLFFLFSSSALLAQSYANIGECFLQNRARLANPFRTNNQPFMPTFSNSLQPESPVSFDNSAWYLSNYNATNDTNAPLINLDYQYEDQDMNALLQVRVQEEAEAEGLNMENIIALPPSSDNPEELLPQLREEIERYNSGIAAGVVPHERTILLPLNISGIHWAGIVIRLDSNNNVTSIKYIDSAGYYKMPEHVRRLLQEVYGEDINIENIYGLIQRDNTGCGPLMIENLIREARGVRGDHYVPRELMRRIRGHHVNLLERYRPDLAFKKRQQNNVRSFRDINKELIGPLLLSGSKGSQDYDACIKLGLTPVICGGGKNTHNKGAEQAGLHDANKDHEDKNKDLSETTDEEASPNWDSLPDELRLEILGYLTPKELSKVVMISKEWSRIANDNVLWLHKTQDEFSPSIVEEAIDIYDESILAPDDGLISNTNGQTEVVETEKDKKAKEDQNKPSERDFKKIYRIGRLLANKSTRLALYRERGRLIEVNDRTPNFSIQQLIEDITSPNSKAKALVIRNIVISVNNAHHLANALKNENCKVAELDLVHNQIGAIGAAALALTLKDPDCKVTELSLEYNQIGAVGAQAIALALKVPNCKVAELNLRWNQIGDAGAQALALALKDPNCKVTELDLDGNHIGAAGVEALTLALKDPNCKVTTLSFAWNQIGAAGARHLVLALKDPNCKVTELDLDGNHIGAAGVEALALALKDPDCKVTALNLVGNQIGAAGAAALVEPLENKNCKVTKLDLEGNQIGAVGAAALASALKDPNCKVTELELGHNRIGDAGARDLALALKDPNCKVTTLDLEQNQIGDAGAQALALALKDPNCKVTTLNLWSNQIDAAGAQDLALALKDENCKITELKLAYNRIGDAGAEAFADSLKDPNCKITQLELGHNQIDAAGTKALVDAVLYVSEEGREIKITGVPYFEEFLKRAEIEARPPDARTSMLMASVSQEKGLY